MPRAGPRRASPRDALEVLDPDDVTWSSDTTSVATVDTNAGLATGASAGTANITARSATYPVTGSTLLTVNRENQTHHLWSARERDLRRRAVCHQRQRLGQSAGDIYQHHTGVCTVSPEP